MRRRVIVVSAVICLGLGAVALHYGPRYWRALMRHLRGQPGGTPAAAFARPHLLPPPPAPKLASGALAVWVAPDGAKVLPDGTIARAGDGGPAAFAKSYPDYRNKSSLWNADARRAHLTAVRGETVALQVIIEARGQALDGVNLTAGELAGELGQHLPAGAIHRYVAHHLRVVGASYAEGKVMTGSSGPGDYPDPLVPAEAPKGGLPMAIGRFGPAGMDPRNHGTGLMRAGGASTSAADTPSLVDVEIVKPGQLGVATFRAREGGAAAVEHVTDLTTPLPGGLTLEWLRPSEGGFETGDRFEVMRYPSFAQPIWLDLVVPETATPGVYQGSVTVSDKAGASLGLTLELKVLPGVLGPPPLLATAQVYRNDLDLGEGAPQSFQSDETWPIEKATYRLLHDHGIDALFREPAVEPDEQGGVPPEEWERYDKSFGSAMDGSLFDDHRPARAFQVSVEPLPAFDKSPASVKDEAVFAARLGAWTSHLEAKGWSSRALAYPIDEPELADYPRVVSIARAVARASSGKIGVLMTEQPSPLDPVDNWYDDATEARLGPDLWTRFHKDPGPSPIAVWAVNARLAFPALEPDNAKNPNVIDRVHEDHARWWFYQLGEPWCGNTILDDDALAFVTWGWIAWRYHADGIFYYAVSHYEQASFDFKNLAGIFINPATFREKSMLLNGDGTMIYPGAPFGLIGPVGSIRMKELRRGILDYSLLAALSAAKGPAAADAAAARVIQRALNHFESGEDHAPYSWRSPPGAGKWMRDVAALESVREGIRADLPAPPPPPAPEPKKKKRGK